MKFDTARLTTAHPASDDVVNPYRLSAVRVCFAKASQTEVSG